MDSLRSELAEISRYTFGAGDVGHLGGDEQQEIAVVRLAMEAGLWFHCSPQYGSKGDQGGTFRFLRKVYDDAGQRPRMIIKLECPTAKSAEADCLKTIEALGLERIDIAQIVGEYIDFSQDFAERGERWQMFKKLKEKGLVGNYLCEVYPSNYAHALDVARDGVRGGQVDGYIYYNNVFERNVPDELDALLKEKKAKLIALRTLSRCYVDYDKFDRGELTLPKTLDATRIEALRPWYEKSGCSNWLDFAMRFTLSQPGIITTIGATKSLEHLREYIEAAERFEMLDEKIVEGINGLRREN